MSREASMNMCKKLIAMHEDKLKDLRRRKESVEWTIAVMERDLEQEKQKLAKLQSEGGK